MHLLLLQGPAHSLRQLLEKLSYGLVVQIAGELRKHFAREDSYRLAVPGVSAVRIGVDDFAAGEHPGQKGGAARRALHRPAMGCPNGLLEIIDTPGRPITGPKSEGDFEFTPRPFGRCHEAKG